MDTVDVYKNNKNDSHSNFHVCIRMRPSKSPSFDNEGHVDGHKYIRTGL